MKSDSKQRKFERQPLTPEQVTALLNAMPTEWQGMVLVSLSTGARLMDVANLKWDDVNMSTMLINFKVLKSSATLVSPMPLELCSFLAVQAKPADPESPMFPSCFKDAQEGTEKLAARFRWLQRKAGLDPVGFYSLRHTFAAVLQKNGVPERLVAKLLGYSDWRHEPATLAEKAEAVKAMPIWQK